MNDNKKESQRDELHRTIWSIANDLRGSVDGWDFKQYVLGILFYRYISENIKEYINKSEREVPGNESFDFAKISDKDSEISKKGIIDDKGFFIYPSELFENVLKNTKKESLENLNETLDKIFKNIEKSSIGSLSEENVKGLFDDINLNSNKIGSNVQERNKTLLKLLNSINEMKLCNYQENEIDAFGDAYEYLMGMYASNAGKSGGEYFTPQEVSELLARITLVEQKTINKVYDPACGSGSLLLQFSKIISDDFKGSYYGQEINITTYNLCRINMFLHDINYQNFKIGLGDTLTNPLHWDDEPFDAIVSNPPYSTKWDGEDNPILMSDERFSKAGILAPKSKADLAFVMHSLSWLSNTGTAAIVCFPGVMYRGGAEAKIRRYLIENNFIDCIIQLPSNLFFGTSISTCIMVLKKNKAENKTLFIDASNEFVKVTNSNKMKQNNLENILKLYKERCDKDYVSKFVHNDLIAQNDFNLSVSTYVEKKDTTEKIDILALNKEIEEITQKQEILRSEINKIIKEIEG